MTGERFTLTDSLLKRALDELAGDPDSHQLTADVLRDAHGIRQERPLWWPISLSPRMGIVLAAALLIVGLLASLAVYAQLNQRPIPPEPGPSSIVIQQSNGQRGEAFAVSHTVFAPGSTAGDPLASQLPKNAISLRWSPDWAQLVYFTREAPPESRGYATTGVFVADTDGANPVPLATARGAGWFGNNGWWTGAAWAPPGGMFALVWDSHGCSDGPDCTPPTGIEIFDSQGVPVTAFDTPDSFAADPVWAPDASAIGWHTGTCVGGVCEHDAFNWRAATAGAGDAVTTLPLLRGSQVGSWSPDNRLMVVTTGGVERIYSMAPDGSDKIVVSWPSAPDTPTWSPDGLRLAVIDRDQHWLVIHEVASGQDTIVQVPDDMGIVDWSPESDRLVLYGNPASDSADDYGLYIVNVDGSGGLLRLGDGEDFGWLPASAQ